MVPQVTGSGSEVRASVALAVKVTVAPKKLVASVVMLDGTMSSGGGFPKMVICTFELAEALYGSVAVNVNTKVPPLDGAWKTAPGLQTTPAMQLPMTPEPDCVQEATPLG